MTPPAPAGVPVNRASPIDALFHSMLWWMRTLVFRPKGIAAPFGLFAPDKIGGQSAAGVTPGLQMVPSLRYTGGVSPLPRLIAPASVPWLAEMRLFATCRLWDQPWMKRPPPPCELLRM